MASNQNVYGMALGKNYFQGPVSNLRGIISQSNRFANLVLIAVALYTYKPDDETKATTDTGKNLMAVGASIGLVSAFGTFVESIYLTKSDPVDPENPNKIRRRVSSSFMVHLVLNSFMSVVVYAAYLFHVIGTDNEFEYTFLVGALDLLVNSVSSMILGCNKKLHKTTFSDFLAIHNPVFSYMRLMIWGKLLHNWSIVWTLPLIPLMIMGWFLLLPGLLMLMNFICKLFSCSLSKKEDWIMLFFSILLGIPFFFTLMMPDFEKTGNSRYILLFFIAYISITMIGMMFFACRVGKYVLWWSKANDAKGRTWDPKEGTFSGITIEKKDS
jgi:uncharacterized membrane protein YqhA